MGILERKIRHKEHVKANILEEAGRIIKECGCEALSIRKIADAIEYSIPVIYSHFENKEAILCELSMEGFECLQYQLQKVVEKYEDPRKQLKAFAEVYWDFAFHNTQSYQLMFGLGVRCGGHGKLKPEVNAFPDMCAVAIEKIMRNNQSNMADHCFKTYALWSVLHGLISIRLMRDSDVDDSLNKKIMEDTVTALINNL